MAPPARNCELELENASRITSNDVAIHVTESSSATGSDDLNPTPTGSATPSFILSLNQRLFGRKTGVEIPKHSKNVQLTWRGLTYEITKFKWENLIKNGICRQEKAYSRRVLLDSVSGSVRSGELVAIMGPSGAGKTTLIECISGRRTIGVSGEIVVSGGGKRTRLAYNAQDDSLMPCLTVWETLLFASKLKNYQKNNKLKVKLVEDNENVYNATTVPDSELTIR